MTIFAVTSVFLGSATLLASELAYCIAKNDMNGIRCLLVGNIPMIIILSFIIRLLLVPMPFFAEEALVAPQITYKKFVYLHLLLSSVGSVCMLYIMARQLPTAIANAQEGWGQLEITQYSMFALGMFTFIWAGEFAARIYFFLGRTWLGA